MEFVNEKRLESFEAFEEQAQELIDEMRQRKITTNTRGYISTPIFRGQSDAKWMPTTTLERTYTQKDNPHRLSSYHGIMDRTKTHIENFTEERFNLPEFNEPTDKFWIIPQGIELMIYLRHSGFPSPLLDWTHSPHIAAFFAFKDASVNTDVSIFVFIGSTGKGKWSDERNDFCVISPIGHKFLTHKRHTLQKSEYTICTKEINNETFYGKHEEIFKDDNPDQDVLIKFILPGNKRNEVLRKLDTMNINSYSLFETEDALMNTLAMREFIITDF
jgi:hypothetical protein